MKRNKYKPFSKSKLFPMLFLGCLAFVVAGFGFALGINTSSDHNYINVKVDPINQISFKLAEGWKQQEDNEDNYLSFISSDYRANPVPAIENGAHISVVRSPKRTNTALREYVNSAIPVPLDSKIVVNEKYIGNIKTLNMFMCWEGCFDSYYLEKDAYVWEIHFSCAPGCSSQTEMEKSNYVKDRDIFLNSIKFK